MKYTKRIFAGVLSIVLLFLALCSYSFAIAPNSKVSIDAQNGMVGDTISIFVRLDSPSVAGVTINLDYDASVFEFVDAQKDIEASKFPMVSANRVGNKNQIRFTALSSNNIKVIGNVMKIRFKILREVSPTRLLVSAILVDENTNPIVAEFKNDDILIHSNTQDIQSATPITANEILDMYKNDSNEVTIKDFMDREIIGDTFVGTGSIIYINAVPMISVVLYYDITGDGNVNTEDYNLMQDCAVGKYTLTNAFLKAADTNADGMLDALDAANFDLQISSQ